MARSMLLALILCCTAATAQQDIVTVPNEPANLDTAKKQLAHYHACTEADCYQPQLDRQADVAIALLQQSVASAKPGEKLALVLDIDETSLSNWSVMQHDDFGYIPNDSDWCIAIGCSPAIASTLRLFREAQKNHVAVFFITGRPEPQRADTEANLKAAGYDHWEGLYLRPQDHPKTEHVADYKSGAHAKIVASGYHIVLNVGDQLSDLQGTPQADRSVKLPNPFYLIP